MCALVFRRSLPVLRSGCSIPITVWTRGLCSSLDSPVPNLLAYEGTTLDGRGALFLKPYDSEVSERDGALLFLPAPDQALNSVSRWMSDCATELYLALAEICGSCFTTGSKRKTQPICL